MHAQTYKHLPVMAAEVMEDLALSEGKLAVDVTAGGGGHLALIAEAVGQNGRVIALDRDPRAHQRDAAIGVGDAYPGRILFFQAAFSELQDILASQRIEKVDALLCDLGVSSPQLDDASRGFSFLREGPIDMRMDTSKGSSAFELLAQLSEKDLANLIFEFGEERFSRRIAKIIHHAWPIPNSTLALADLIAKGLGRRGKIHPATRTFQALRIAVNKELSELDQLLAMLPAIINLGGRVVFISFHSLEDRRVKHAFRELAKMSDGFREWRILHKKPIEASAVEMRSNPRARSAKLRSIERLSFTSKRGVI